MLGVRLSFNLLFLFPFYSYMYSIDTYIYVISFTVGCRSFGAATVIILRIFLLYIRGVTGGWLAGFTVVASPSLPLLPLHYNVSLREKERENENENEVEGAERRERGKKCRYPQAFIRNWSS